MLAQFGRHKIIREVLFTTDLNPTAENCSAMLLSTGSEETSKLLLQDERINPMEIGAELRKFKAETLKLLLMDERVDPSMNNNLLFQESCRFGNLQICKLLLQNENVDPSAHNNWALKVAKKFHRYRIEELLLTDQRVLDRITN
ncbi:hypothetical protein HK099_001514 [Clydaea vesicula]|uniref:Uncharacterized protein n=1 Tax=Clydaea vesicula TaxID=447962 RepID=A0AAD5XX36_9FUNG|nr:hypothetical protein HK099_001514 [Clydaea vesicula]